MHFSFLLIMIVVFFVLVILLKSADQFVCLLSIALMLLALTWLVVASLHAKQIHYVEHLKVRTFSNWQVIEPTGENDKNVQNLFGRILDKDAEVKRTVYRKWYFGVYFPVDDKYESK